MAEKKKAAKKEEAKKSAPKGKYIFAVGRRKSARAKVKLFLSGKGDIIINKRDFTDYFPTLQLQKSVLRPLVLLGLEKKVTLEANTAGGGLNAQSEAIGLGVARALVKNDQETKTTLKKQGLLTRDARVKERKKPGLKRARRAPQWQKR